MPPTDPSVHRELPQGVTVQQPDTLLFMGDHIDNKIVGDVLSDFPEVRHISLSNTQLTDEGLLHLDLLERCDSLWLKICLISDQCLMCCKKTCWSLRNLSVIACDLTDNFSPSLAACASLVTMRLSHLRLTDFGVQTLPLLPHLVGLYFFSLSVGDAAIPSVTTRQQLRSLGLSGTIISDLSIEYLTSLTELEALFLNETKISDLALPSIIRLQKLKDLRLANTSITDEGIALLGSLPYLELLVLRSTKVTAQALSVLKAIRPNLTVEM